MSNTTDEECKGHAKVVVANTGGIRNGSCLHCIGGESVGMVRECR